MAPFLRLAKSVGPQLARLLGDPVHRQGLGVDAIVERSNNLKVVRADTLYQCPIDANYRHESPAVRLASAMRLSDLDSMIRVGPLPRGTCRRWMPAVATREACSIRQRRWFALAPRTCVAWACGELRSITSPRQIIDFRQWEFGRASAARPSGRPALQSTDPVAETECSVRPVQPIIEGQDGMAGLGAERLDRCGQEPRRPRPNQG